MIDRPHRRASHKRFMGICDRLDELERRMKEIERRMKEMEDKATEEEEAPQ